MEYDYPGNVRELENIISRAAIISENIIEDITIPESLNKPAETSSSLNILPKEGVNIDELNKSLIIQALEHTDGNKTKAAALLGITRRRLYSMMKSYAIE